MGQLLVVQSSGFGGRSSHTSVHAAHVLHTAQSTASNAVDITAQFHGLGWNANAVLI